MQKINLYTAQYPPSETVKVSGKVSSIIIVVVVILVSAGSLFYWKIEGLQQELGLFKASTSFTEKALSKIKNELKKSADDDTLKIDLLTIKDELRHKQALKEQLDQESTELSNSFYSRFLALSNQDINGLWLIKIAFDDKGKKTTLTGAAKNANLLTEYLQKLSNEPIFSGTAFKVLHIGTREANTKTNEIYFVISTDAVPEVESLRGMLENLDKKTDEGTDNVVNKAANKDLLSNLMQGLKR